MAHKEAVGTSGGRSAEGSVSMGIRAWRQGSLQGNGQHVSQWEAHLLSWSGTQLTLEVPSEARKHYSDQMI